MNYSGFSVVRRPHNDHQKSTTETKRSRVTAISRMRFFPWTNTSKLQPPSPCEMDRGYYNIRRAPQKIENNPITTKRDDTVLPMMAKESDKDRQKPIRKIDDNVDYTSCLDEDSESGIEEDLDFIDQNFGVACNCEEEESKYDGVDRGEDLASIEIPDPPPTTPRIDERNRYRKTFTEFGSQIYDYDGTRRPRRSSMKRTDGTTVSRGVNRSHSMEGTGDTMKGSGALHSVRIRGSLVPVQRRRSIEFQTDVMIQEVTPTVVLNDNNHRDLWLQADEVEAMKNDRRSFIKQYKQREAQRQKSEEQDKQKEMERRKKEQKMKNGLRPTKKPFLDAIVSSFSPQGNKGSTPKNCRKRLSWTAVIKKPDLFTSSPTRSKAATQSLMDPSLPEMEGVDPFLPIRTSKVPFSSTSMDRPLAERGSSSSSLWGFSSSLISSSSISGSGSDREVDSLRGLEKYIDKSGRIQKNMALDAVLIEQDEQEQYGYYDEEKIARRYQMIQKEHNAEQKVLDRARKDRQAADKYLMTPRTMHLMKKTPLGLSTNTMTPLPIIGNPLQTDERNPPPPPSLSNDDYRFRPRQMRRLSV